jgi:hypothetical protein
MYSQIREGEGPKPPAELLEKKVKRGCLEMEMGA